MLFPNKKQQKILQLILTTGSLRSSALHDEMIKQGEDVSLVTVKRMLSEMAGQGVLVVTGSGRATSYTVSTLGRAGADIDAGAYCSTEPDRRHGQGRYNFDLFSNFPAELFSEEELQHLERATVLYRAKVKDLPSAIQKKELERLMIELSWKSSKIEGNTYTLLDTEKLILENKKASGKTEAEARMILNHKEAFQFVRKNAGLFTTMTRKHLEALHAILVKDMHVGLGLRKKPVGVVGSLYRPLDNIHQIVEAVDALQAAVNRMTTPYSMALAGLLGVSYIQPFEDGNKRTGRLLANALLLAHGCAPLSYRSVDENAYREAMLVFYELNSIMPFKKIFKDQYLFATQHYAIAA